MPSPITVSRPPLLPLAAFGLAAAFALTPWATPALALALGALLSLTLATPPRRSPRAEPGTCSRRRSSASDSACP